VFLYGLPIDQEVYDQTREDTATAVRGGVPLFWNAENKTALENIEEAHRLQFSPANNLKGKNMYGFVQIRIDINQHGMSRLYQTTPSLPYHALSNKQNPTQREKKYSSS